MTQPETPKEPALIGVVLVFLDEKGNAIAHAADFEQQRPGGFSLNDAQRLRARQQLAVNVTSAYASPNFARGLEVDDAVRVMGRLCRQFGCKVHQINIGAVDE